MNTIRLNKKQRDKLHVSPGDTAVFKDGQGNVRRAKVKRALLHHIASGLHTKEYAPCEVHDGPSPRPERALVSSIERKDADPTRCIECGAAYTEACIDGGRCIACGVMICAEVPVDA